MINAKQNDVIVLKDYNTLEAIGEEFQSVISEVNKWRLSESVVFTGYEIEVDTDTTLMLLECCVENEVDYVLYRKWTESPLNALDLPSSIDITSKDVSGEINFRDTVVLDVDGDDDPNAYSLISPYPIWDVKKDDGVVALVKYGIISHDAVSYWAKHFFIEWFAYADEDVPENGWCVAWFGWDVSEEDFDIIKS